MPIVPKTTAAQVAAAVAAAAVGCLVYAAGYEVRAYRLRRVDVPVLQAGQRPLRVLHISDLHMTHQNKKHAWVRSLAALEPDLVVNTGDNLAHQGAVPTVLDSLGPLCSTGRVRPRVQRLLRADAQEPGPLPAPVPADLVHHARSAVAGAQGRLRDAGWLDLTNTRGRLEVDGRALAFAGVNDPHTEMDRYGDVAGPAEPADLTVGITHAPYRRILDAMAADGYRLLLAGHTHGGSCAFPVGVPW